MHGNAGFYPPPLPPREGEPTFEEVVAAVQLLNRQWLPVYQALYFEKLALPGGGGEFEVRRDPVALACVRVTKNGKGNEWYSFLTRSSEGVLDKARLIMQAVKDKQQKCDGRACCPLAEFRGCVCTVSFQCPLHGTRCHGTHD